MCRSCRPDGPEVFGASDQFVQQQSSDIKPETHQIRADPEAASHQPLHTELLQLEMFHNFQKTSESAIGSVTGLRPSDSLFRTATEKCRNQRLLQEAEGRDFQIEGGLMESSLILYFNFTFTNPFLETSKCELRPKGETDSLQMSPQRSQIKNTDICNPEFTAEKP